MADVLFVVTMYPTPCTASSESRLGEGCRFGYPAPPLPCTHDCSDHLNYASAELELAPIVLIQRQRPSDRL